MYSDVKTKDGERFRRVFNVQCCNFYQGIDDCDLWQKFSICGPFWHCCYREQTGFLGKYLNIESEKENPFKVVYYKWHTVHHITPRTIASDLGIWGHLGWNIRSNWIVRDQSKPNLDLDRSLGSIFLGLTSSWWCMYVNVLMPVQWDIFFEDILCIP